MKLCFVLIFTIVISTDKTHTAQSNEEQSATKEAEDIFFHHNHEQSVLFLRKVNEICPEITRIYNLTEPSVEGRNLTVIEITENPGVHMPGNFFFLKWVG